MVLRKYVFSRLKADTSLSHSHVATGKIANRLENPTARACLRSETIFEILTWKFILIKKIYIYYEKSNRFP